MVLLESDQRCHPFDYGTRVFVYLAEVLHQASIYQGGDGLRLFVGVLTHGGLSALMIDPSEGSRLR